MGEGRLIGLARKAAKFAPMEVLEAGRITVEAGLLGDYCGTPKPGKLPKRQVTILAREAWEESCAEIGRTLDWTARRANLLVEDIELPRWIGDVIAIGEVRLEVMAETNPCWRMDAAAIGLKMAMRPKWRGGVSCKVLAGGDVRIGDAVTIEPRSPKFDFAMAGEEAREQVQDAR